MATAAMTAAYPVLGASYPGNVGRRFMSVGAGKPTSHGLDQDYTLVERCLSGDATGWEELVRLHTRRVYGLCYRFTSSEAEAQDLTQEIFLRVFRSLKSYRSTEGAFSTWLTRLSRNLLIDHYRRTRQERLTDPIDDQIGVLEQKSTAEWPPCDPTGLWRDAKRARFCRRLWLNFRRSCARRSSSVICRNWSIVKLQKC